LSKRESDTRADAPRDEPARRPRRTVIWIVVLGVLLIAGGAGAWRVDRVSKDPKFCDSCHVGAVHALGESAHKDKPCSACHENRPEQNLRQWALGLYSKKSTPHGKLDRSRCKSCHAEGVTETWQMARTLGHAQHVLKADPPLDCDKCHVLEDHKTEPNPDSCAECHKDVAIYGAHSEAELKKKVRCLSCHNYLARIGAGHQTPSHDCRRCHGGVKEPERSARFADVIPAKAVSASQIHGNLQACTLCHNPHAKDPKKRQSGFECGRCHGKISKERHATKQPDRFDCSTCHQAHGSREELKTSCHRCHEDKAKQKNSVAARHDRCARCHKPHEFTATYAGCRDCHKDQTTTLASWKAETHADCTNCHKPHSEKEEATTCVRCHKKAGHEHKACTTCHDPHKSKADVKSCAGCHKGEGNLLARTVAPHRAAACLTCHQPHAMAQSKKACNRCHAKEVGLVSSARVAPHQRCESCHQTHAWRANVDACRACHKNPTSGAHTGKCTSCHQAHGSPIGQAASCRNCHKDTPKPGGKHAECQSCHKSAHGQVMAPACGTCHSSKATLLAGWPGKSHQSCTQCHKSHDPTNPKACGECHKSQASQVARIASHRCTGCHDAHQPPKSLWNACAKCHGQELKAVSGRGPTHSVCKSCHKQHDVTPPSCTSCHKKLAFAHTVKAHANCSDCHETHRHEAASRSDCMRCHKDKASHFPNAESCAGCHPFAKGR
jgi:Cytochrome c3